MDDCPMLRSFSLILQVVIIRLPAEKPDHVVSQVNVNITNIFYLGVTAEVYTDPKMPCALGSARQPSPLSGRQTLPPFGDEVEPPLLKLLGEIAGCKNATLPQIALA